ncbi:hypothetical protein HYPSUDRAFT_57905 [Hypholoma sublateritium FD-334 SS-4]|uniref:Uncharacterized protein n=1 Tax=Hypholoma sublateritium (strain FD-334 SS-4) TaxID=945553 RepID=A0A0D2M1M8_HYPSF|nr:hypothetical protein HYPSUDRAFT_57905 [Hypholoma sublateritium FD-334 SS-4]
MYSATREQLDKRRFIHRMGPYYLQAKSEDKVDDFFAMVFAHYMDRWPIDTSKYINADFKKSDMERQKTTLCESIRVWAGMGSFEADKHWQDLFKYGDPIAQHGLCTQQFMDTQSIQSGAQGSTSEHDASVGNTLNNPIDVDSAIPFSPRPASALPPRPRPRLRRREPINRDDDGCEYISGPSKRKLIIDPNVIEL